MYTRLCYIK